MEVKFIDRHTQKEITEHPPAEGLMRFIYDHPIGKIALLPLVKRKIVSAWYGRKMDAPTSTSKIAGFVSQLGIDMSESVKSIAEFTSFNDFFYRKLKPSARPIGQGIVSPGDGKLLAFESIKDVGSFFVKGQEFDLKTFLQDATLAEKYQSGAMVILRLAPNDYHRFHFPYGGSASDVTHISGAYYSVSPIALAHNFVRVFCENKRDLCSLHTSAVGDILLIPVGATMVGSMVYTFSPNTSLQKGDEMGYFKFGGSTIVVLLQKDKVQIDHDLLVNTRAGKETFVKMGEKIGIALK